MFTVVGNKIRWADLARTKDEWDRNSHRGSKDSSSDQTVYRSLKAPIYYQITALSVSPSGHFLAICTEHTVHVALLPDRSRLHDGDQSEIKLKAYHLGPTTHVIPEAALVSVLWHPLAASSPANDCLVTVTTEAAVRVWEIDRSNHWSFERPALAIDLRKLADGTSSDEDFEPFGFGKSRGFSADLFDMEASAACWGGKATENEDPWAAMTLWTSMTNGDVYALCPLLPSKWRPTATTVPSLTTSAVSRMASIATEDVDPDERRAADQRYEWVQELDDQDLGDTSNDSVLMRPSNPSAIPRLQGPFQISVDDTDDDIEVSDILVMPANLDEEDLFSGEEDHEVLGSAKSLPFTVVCLVTTDNILHLMIELDGVTGQWLPKKGRSHFSVPTGDAGEFILIESLSLHTEARVSASRPSFTIDTLNPYHFFVTTGYSVISVSLEDWASRIGFEVSEDESEEVDAGLQGRLKLACQGQICVKKEMISYQQHNNSSQALLSTASLIEEADIGSILLTSTDGRAIAAQLDQDSLRTSRMLTSEPALSASTTSPFRTSQALIQVMQDDPQTSEAPATRAPYAPSAVFYLNHMARLEQFKSGIPGHRRSMLTDKTLRLSPACLDIMTYAHRTFSHQTADVEKAAAELFRRCERLREELADQVRQMAELAERLNHLKTGDASEEQNIPIETKPHSEQMTDRIQAAKVRQLNLFRRYEQIRRKAGQVGHAKQDLSITERAWIEEVDSLAKHVGVDGNSAEEAISQRLSDATSLTQQLKAAAHKVNETTAQNNEKQGSSTPEGKTRTRLGGGISIFQRKKIKEVTEMVEREAAIIEAVQGRLSRMSVSS